MNKPASKEPSMDEILSSIRQIIADEDEPQDGAALVADAQVATAPDSESAADKEMIAVEETTQNITPEAIALAQPSPESAAPVAPKADVEPFSLSPDQMVADTKVEEDTSDIDGIDFSPASSGMDAKLPPSTEAKDDAKPAEPEPELLSPEPASEPELVSPEPEEIPVDVTADLVIADDIAFNEVEGELEVEIVPEVEEEPSAMPDPDLSADIADKLLEPATTAAVGSAFAKLGVLSAIGGDGLTLDAIVREMLRPMLKEWLDENLPATVERMVEKEIERVSRGS